MTWINDIMNSQQVTAEDIKRIHFVGNLRNKNPRPIIMKMFNYVKKEQFLKVIKSKQELLVYRGKPIQIYQDLSRKSISWKKTMINHINFN